MTSIKTLLSASALSLIAVPAFAAMSVTATTDLNVRAGPGPQHPVETVIGVDQQATLNGCLEDSKWCQVTVNGQTGWAYSDYLTTDMSGERVVVYEQRQQIGVPTVTYESSGGAVAGGASGAVAGALIGGPIGAAVGGAAGAVIGASISPSATTTTYVESNPVDPVYLEGEVVVGAQLPPEVQLYEVPQAEYRYVYVNGQRVLVQPDNRQIVYVYR
ncbi:DUF1236 domain-containing protein [Pseudohoeflea coraliihabitans]|uniref:DUF1236 domain-containing protein n=1 Tax=Pseudohoeflea coraliihabitans TaxID=2860393 RepID=A0ABS6WJN7_9HYPH|nr:DUF1236 domain-containing protein [Pseudohoeflea sp. DP4N28-3]MBW3096070.1 DUF1236 domain-containing protein [Pseudohoeflea sp. DP4N28-3]